jgi:hypothetical protein
MATVDGSNVRNLHTRRVTMKRKMQLMLAAAMLAPMAGVLAQQQQQQTQLPTVGVHPVHQSQKKMAKDESHCTSYASRRTGFEPVAIAANSTPLQEGKDKTTVTVEAPSTAVGASSAGATTAGAAPATGAPTAGATGASTAGATGASAGGMPAHHGKKHHAQVASTEPSIDAFNRVFGRCMTSRGYIVEKSTPVSTP